MAERARLANIPLPEPALKCPRCESTNTKFCYFNNYNLSQPRHFCKTCRRYWTRGGALRSVPVGGGCRRNKRSKSSSSSKSPAASGDNRQTINNNNNPNSTISSINNPTINSGAAANLLGLGPQFTPLRFMSPLSHLTANFASDNGMELNNYSGITAPAGDMNFHGGSNLLGGCSIDGRSNIEPWRLQQVQQYPFLWGLDQSSAGTYQFHGMESNFMAGGHTSHHHDHHQVRPKFSGSMPSQISSVKTEPNPELNLSGQLLGNVNGNEQWNPANWTDLSSFTSSSTSNPL